MTIPFEPDWTVAPKLLLAEYLEVTPASQMAYANPAHAEAITAAVAAVMAKEPLTADHAAALEVATGAPARFWLRLETLYRDGLAAGLTDATDT